MSIRQLLAPAATEFISPGSDFMWFLEHPGRWYRVRQGSGGHRLVTRRRRSNGADYYLRVIVDAAPPSDTDDALRRLWVAAAWSDLTPKQQLALIKQIRRAERG